MIFSILDIYFKLFKDFKVILLQVMVNTCVTIQLGQLTLGGLTRQKILQVRHQCVT